MPPNDKTAPTPSKSEAQIIADAIGEAIRANRPQGPLEQAGFTEAQIAQLTEIPKAKRWREIPCRSEETGATFIACVVESRGMPHGRIVELKEYRHPQTAVVFVKDGGLVPDQMQILRAGMAPPTADPNTIPKQDYTTLYLQWRWTEFWKQDLRRYVGKEIKAHLAVDAEAFSKPWQEGHVRREDAS